MGVCPSAVANFHNTGKKLIFLGISTLLSRLTGSEVTVCGGDKADKQMIRKTAQRHKLVSLGNGATDYYPGNLRFFKIATSGYSY